MLWVSTLPGVDPATSIKFIAETLLLNLSNELHAGRFNSRGTENRPYRCTKLSVQRIPKTPYIYTLSKVKLSTNRVALQTHTHKVKAAGKIGPRVFSVQQLIIK